jgi:hypothetical protein
MVITQAIVTTMLGYASSIYADATRSKVSVDSVHQQKAMQAILAAIVYTNLRERESAIANPHHTADDLGIRQQPLFQLLMQAGMSEEEANMVINYATFESDGRLPLEKLLNQTSTIARSIPLDMAAQHTTLKIEPLKSTSTSAVIA